MLEFFLDKVKNQIDLSEEESFQVLQIIFSGQCKLEEIIALLANLAIKGESVNEIIGFTKAMWQNAVKIDLLKDSIDTCGTGGSNRPRFNVSTAAAFVMAAGGVPVIKHGNRGSKTANGSFDFLEALGISFEVENNQIVELFNKTNLCFLFARNFHLAMKHVSAARKQIPGRTIFNLIGPLCNPARVNYQVLGTTSSEIAAKLAHALAQFETKKALVIVGADGFDELSLTHDSLIYEVSKQNINKIMFSPESLNIKLNSSVVVGSALENANLFVKLIQEGNIEHPNSLLIALNAGAGFYCFGKKDSIIQGFEYAKELIINKKVYEKYEEVRFENL
ncbi:MAG: anthranilate phosphoribosyltransferase [Candidatus Margulisiibacteriota bacterium]|jgi:anthranilate phosphoribosyltransferase